MYLPNGASAHWNLYGLAEQNEASLKGKKSFCGYDLCHGTSLPPHTCLVGSFSIVMGACQQRDFPHLLSCVFHVNGSGLMPIRGNISTFVFCAEIVNENPSKTLWSPAVMFSNCYYLAQLNFAMHKCMRGEPSSIALHFLFCFINQQDVGPLFLKYLHISFDAFVHADVHSVNIMALSSEQMT